MVLNRVSVTKPCKVSFFQSFVHFFHEIFSQNFRCNLGFPNFLYIFFLLLSVKIEGNEEFLKSGQYPVLSILSAGHALHVFVNGQLSGRQHYCQFQGFFDQLLWIVTSSGHWNESSNFISWHKLLLLVYSLRHFLCFQTQPELNKVTLTSGACLQLDYITFALLISCCFYFYQELRMEVWNSQN